MLLLYLMHQMHQSDLIANVKFSEQQYTLNTVCFVKIMKTLEMKNFHLLLITISIFLHGIPSSHCWILILRKVSCAGDCIVQTYHNGYLSFVYIQ